MTNTKVKREREQGGSIRIVAAISALVIMVALTAGTTAASEGKGDASHRQEEEEHHEEDRVGSKFYGTIQQIPPGRIGTWVVNNREILVAKETRIKERFGTALVGAYVEIEGHNTGKIFNAQKIEVKRAKK